MQEEHQGRRGHDLRLVGATTDQSQQLACVLKLTLWNVKPGNWGVYGRIGKKEGGLAIRIDSVANTPPALEEQYKGRCLNNQNRAILAPYKRVKIGGVTSDELQFTVPPVLLHPAFDENGNPSIDAVVRDVFSKIKQADGQEEDRQEEPHGRLLQRHRLQGQHPPDPGHLRGRVGRGRAQPGRQQHAGSARPEGLTSGRCDGAVCGPPRRVGSRGARLPLYDRP